MKRNQGFTLIELVVVVVLLGILAATALPRFADLSSDARDAANKGVSGAFASGVNLARSLSEIRSLSAISNFSGSNYSVYFNSRKWPVFADTDVTLAGATTVPSNIGCVNLFGALLANGPTVDVGSSDLTLKGSEDYWAYGVNVATTDTNLVGCAYLRTDGTEKRSLFIYDSDNGVVEAQTVTEDELAGLLGQLGQ